MMVLLAKGLAAFVGIVLFVVWWDVKGRDDA